MLKQVQHDVKRKYKKAIKTNSYGFDLY